MRLLEQGRLKRLPLEFRQLEQEQARVNISPGNSGGNIPSIGRLWQRVDVPVEQKRRDFTFRHSSFRKFRRREILAVKLAQKS